MSLPKWIIDHYQNDGKDEQYRQALEIAWEFIEKMSKGNRYPGTLSGAKEAMRRISSLGSEHEEIGK